VTQATRVRFPVKANLMFVLQEMTLVKSLYSGDPDVMCMTVGAIRVKALSFEAVIINLSTFAG
jgi:hypothetical protein